MAGQIERVSLVTGGKEGGIAFATAELLGQLGPVYLTAHYLRDALPAARDLEKKGLTVVPFGLDVTRPSDADPVVQHAADNYGGINTLVTSAAIFPSADREQPISRVPLAEVKEIFTVVALGTLGVIQAVLPSMEEGEYGRITLVYGSWGSHTRARDQLRGRGGGYGMAKAAETYVLAAVAAELEQAEVPRDILINGVDPGKVKTNMNPSGVRAPEEAARDIVQVATLPKGIGISGVVFRDGEQVPYDSYPGMIAPSSR